MIGPLAAGLVGMLIFAGIAGGLGWYGAERLRRDAVTDSAGNRRRADRGRAQPRARLMATAQELQDRLSPKTLAKGAWQGAKEKGADLAEDAVDAVTARPLAASGVVAAITMFLAREPLWTSRRSSLEGVSGQAQDQEAPQDRKPSNRTDRRRQPNDRSGQRATAAGTVHAARQRAIEAYDGARDRAADTLGEAPLIALAGGLAAGALIAALLPRTDGRDASCSPDRPAGEGQRRARLRGRARTPGSDKLDELGITREKGEDTLRSLFEGVTDAARASARPRSMPRATRADLKPRAILLASAP